MGCVCSCVRGLARVGREGASKNLAYNLRRYMFLVVNEFLMKAFTVFMVLPASATADGVLSYEKTFLTKPLTTSIQPEFLSF